MVWGNWRILSIPKAAIWFARWLAWGSSDSYLKSLFGEWKKHANPIVIVCKEIILGISVLFDAIAISYLSTLQSHIWWEKYSKRKGLHNIFSTAFEVKYITKA